MEGWAIDDESELILKGDSLVGVICVERTRRPLDMTNEQAAKKR